MGKSFRSRSAVIAAIAGASAVGCTSSSGTTTNGDAGGSATPLVGSISLQQIKSASSTIYDLNALFTKPTQNVCTSTTTGACSVSTCPPPGGAGGEVGSALNAGPITVSTPSTSAVLTFTGSGSIGHYAQASGSSAFFAGGDVVSASGAGATDLPSFPAQTVIAPNDVTVTAPVCAATCPALDRTTDFVLSWTGGGAGNVELQLQSGTATSIVDIACTFDATAGTGTVPTALLAQLAKAGDPGITGAMTVTASNQVTFNVGTATTTMTLEATDLLSPLTVSK